MDYFLFIYLFYTEDCSILLGSWDGKGKRVENDKAEDRKAQRVFIGSSVATLISTNTLKSLILFQYLCCLKDKLTKITTMTLYKLQRFCWNINISMDICGNIIK